MFGADLLAAGATDMTMRANPGFNAIFFRFAISANNNGPTRVVFSDFCDELRVLFQRPRRFAVNRKIDQRSARHRAFALRPQFFQLAVDLVEFDLKA